MSLQIVTANRLRDGAVVYLTAAHGWSEVFGESLAFGSDAEAKAALDGTAVDVKARVVVGPYLAEAREMPEGLQPTNARERNDVGHSDERRPRHAVHCRWQQPRS